jgi:outer membrane biogenesis lipoprotein LolB
MPATMNSLPETLSFGRRLGHPRLLLSRMRDLNAFRLLCFALILFQGAILAGCAHLLPGPQDQPEARRLLDQIRSNGKAISSFKGLARIRMASNGRVMSGRIAIAAAAPDKMRVEWLNPMGQPVTSMNADGQHITLFSRIDNTCRRFHQSATGLAPLIHIPIGINDLYDILIGSVPLPQDAFVQFKQDLSASDTLVLNNRWHRTIADIQVDLTGPRPQFMRIFDGQGELGYEIQWLRWRHDGSGYDLPVRIDFRKDDGQRLTLTVERFWPNEKIPPSVFSADHPADQ